jgi:hypothetical protein
MAHALKEFDGAVAVKRVAQVQHALAAVDLHSQSLLHDLGQPLLLHLPQDIDRCRGAGDAFKRVRFAVNVQRDGDAFGLGKRLRGLKLLA